MARKRKGLSKKVRFEVFKRDKFACQYCGNKAPDVVLECDHIEPVATGGEDALINLVTACEDCNAGKGARKLDDQTVVLKQRAELERLAARREQVEMMLAWHREMGNASDYEHKALCGRWAELAHPFYLTQVGMDDARKWLRTFGLQDLLAAMEVAISNYLKRDQAGKPTLESVNIAWSKIPGIARVTKLPQAEKDLYYIRGILRKRCNYINQAECMSFLREAHSKGIGTDWMKEVACECTSWSNFWKRVSTAMAGTSHARS